MNTTMETLLKMYDEPLFNPPRLAICELLKIEDASLSDALTKIGMVSRISWQMIGFLLFKEYGEVLSMTGQSMTQEEFLKNHSVHAKCLGKRHDYLLDCLKCYHWVEHHAPYLKIWGELSEVDTVEDALTLEETLVLREFRECIDTVSDKTQEGQDEIELGFDTEQLFLMGELSVKQMREILNCMWKEGNLIYGALPRTIKIIFESNNMGRIEYDEDDLDADYRPDAEKYIRSQLG